MIIDRETFIEAAARRDLNFMLGTPDSVAHHLMRYDDAFKAADYTSLVALVREWQSASAQRQKSLNRSGASSV